MIIFYILILRNTLKCPIMHNERFIFWFGSPNNRLTCMQGQKNLSLVLIMHLFLPYLLNDSQTIRSSIHFSKPLLCVTLICVIGPIWSHFHFIMLVMPDKAALWAQ